MLATELSPPSTAEHCCNFVTVERTDKDLFQTFSSDSWASSQGKRVFDVAVSAAALVVCMPVFAAIAVAIKCDSSGPVLFRQRRLGKGQTLFTIYKFRTMRKDAALLGSTVTVKGDSRLTGLGKLLRRFKLDELPQLFNVLRGDMSMVGPRPKLALHEKMNLTCRPGITGAATLVFAREEEFLAQVDVDEVEQYTIEVLNPVKARLDTDYAENGTFMSDLCILACTAFRLSPGSTPLDLPELSEAVPDFALES